MKGFSAWRPYPWHGLPPGPDPPAIVNAYIETTPFDLVKYEIDKVTGYLCVDRPQATSSLPPSLYGFIAGQENSMSIVSEGGREEALQIVQAAIADYEE
jgi:hypothetical protein